MEDKSEITVYSVEYGLNLKTLPTERDRLHINYSVFDQNIINEKFIAKKTMRDKKNLKKSNTTRTTEVNGDDDFENPPMGTLETQENNESLQNQKTKEIKSKEQKQQKHTGNEQIISNQKQNPSQNIHNMQSQNMKQKIQKMQEKNQSAHNKKNKIKHEESEESNCNYFLI